MLKLEESITVEPVYKGLGHSREPENVPFMNI